jgi:hypothetical protein
MVIPTPTPGHPSVRPPDCPSNLLPMYPVYSVTYLPGSDPRGVFPLLESSLPIWMADSQIPFYVVSER